MFLQIYASQPENRCTNIMAASDAFPDMQNDGPIIRMNHSSPEVNAGFCLTSFCIIDAVFKRIVTPYHISGSKIKQAGHDMS